MKYVIKLRSKHTGDEIWLGSQYDSPETAKCYAEKEVRNDCNSYSIIPINEGLIWHDKITGFKDKNFIPYPCKRQEATFYRQKVKLMDELEITKRQRKKILQDGQVAAEMLLEIESHIEELSKKQPKRLTTKEN